MNEMLQRDKNPFLCHMQTIYYPIILGIMDKTVAKIKKCDILNPEKIVEGVLMYKLCKTEQSAKRQRELERGLLAAMNSHQYEEISVSDLCDQMGIPRKSFYRYFSSKDGALHALIDHTLLEYESFSVPLKTGEKRTYQTDLERFFRFWKEQKPLLDALARSGISGVLVTRSIDHALSDAGAPTRFLPQDERIAREHATMFGVCGLMSMVLNWHQSGYSLSERQMAAIGVQLLTKPLFADLDKYY